MTRQVKQEVSVPCSCCGGTGQRRISGAYLRTLEALRGQREPINGAQLAVVMGVGGSAMANRLVWLEKHGLAKREENGRECLWTATV